MEKATRMLNLLSAVIMCVTGLYIHVAFNAILTPATKVLLWWTIFAYAILQIVLTYRPVRKHIGEK